jgi:hypothetical protein
MVSVDAAKAEPLKANKAKNTLRRNTDHRRAAAVRGSDIDRNLNVFSDFGNLKCALLERRAVAKSLIDVV